jgi:hypothetical protein
MDGSLSSPALRWAIQYSAKPEIQIRRRSVLDAPLSQGMTRGNFAP